MDKAWTELLLATIAGGLLGGVFFGGLWWTVRKSLASPRPALWVAASLLLRMAVALAGFYAVGGGQWQRLLACLLGFFMARLAITRWTSSLSEARHAP